MIMNEYNEKCVYCGNISNTLKREMIIIKRDIDDSGWQQRFEDIKTFYLCPFCERSIGDSTRWRIKRENLLNGWEYAIHDKRLVVKFQKWNVKRLKYYIKIMAPDAQICFTELFIAVIYAVYCINIAVAGKNAKLRA